MQGEKRGCSEKVWAYRREDFLDPLDAVRLQNTSKLDRVGHRERHVAVERQREVRANLLSVLLENGNVLAKAFITSGRTIRARYLDAQVCETENGVRSCYGFDRKTKSVEFSQC